MRTNRYNTLTLDICEYAVIECFKHKWTRSDVLEFIEKVVGIPRDQMILARHTDYRGDLIGEAITGVGLFLYEIATDLCENDRTPDDFIAPVKVELRRDGVTGKLRDIATLCMTHQLLEHLAKNLIWPLLKAKITQTQHASIPGRGQTSIKRQTQRYLRRNKLAISKFAKTDIRRAYESTTYSLCIKMIGKEVPKAKELLTILRYLKTLAPGGHLIIGGYLDAWLFNYMCSYMIRIGVKFGYTRREIKHIALKRIATYMDDFVLFSCTTKGIQVGFSGLWRWVRTNFHMDMIVKKRPTSVSKGIDIAGFIVFYNRVLIRKSIWKRMRRVYIRAYRELKEIGTIRLKTARKVISYNGYIKQSNSFNIYENYHIKELMRVSRRTVKFHNWFDRKRREEKLDDIRKRIFQQQSGSCAA